MIDLWMPVIVTHRISGNVGPSNDVQRRLLKAIHNIIHSWHTSIRLERHVLRRVEMNVFFFCFFYSPYIHKVNDESYVGPRHDTNRIGDRVNARLH